MSDLPQQVMVWHGYTDLEHIGMWSTTRYPEDAVAYVPLARLEAVEKERDAFEASVKEREAEFARKIGKQEARAERAEAQLSTARRDAGLLNRIVLPMIEQRSREHADAWDQAAAAIRALADEAET